MITQKIKLNLIPGGILPRIKASQYDNGTRNLVFSLYNGAQPFEIPSGSTVSIRGTKKDNTGFQYECEFSGNEVAVKITEQMTAFPGDIETEIVITNSNGRISTGNFIIENEKAALDEDVIISETDIPVIERLNDITQQIKDDAKAVIEAKDAAASSASAADTSAKNASESATNATKSATNAATFEADAEASKNAAKLSETNAGNSAIAAETSATNAETSATKAETSAENAATSKTNAETSAENAKLWAVGPSGSGSAEPSDTNNAYYWAQIAATAAAGGLEILPVDELPTTNISTRTIYLVPSADPASGNARDEYLNLDGTTTGWEMIGSTRIDLTNYYTKSQIDALMQDVKDYADAKLATKLSEDYANVYGAKNLLPYPYYKGTETLNGITFTDNGDGSVTVNGTATAVTRHTIQAPSSFNYIDGEKYTLTGCPEGGGNNIYRLYTQGENYFDNGNGVSFEWDSGITGIAIAIYNGVTVNNLTFKPMLRLASITDDTWAPYVQTNKQLQESKVDWKSHGVLGAKNLIPYPYYESTKTFHGITWESNNEGVITCNGTSTGEGGSFNLNTATNDGVLEINPKKEYIISEGNGVSSRTSLGLGFRLYKDGDIISTTTGTNHNLANYTDKYKFKFTGYKYIYVYIYNYSKDGTTVSNLTFKPMLRLAEDTDDTWQPYAKTNRELTPYEYPTMEKAQAAADAGMIPDGTFVYVPGTGGESTKTTYTYDSTTRGLIITGGDIEYGYDENTRGLVIV